MAPVVFQEGDPRLTGISVSSSIISACDAISVLQRQKQMLSNDHLCDAVFLVGPDRGTATRVPVLSYHLRMASDAFNAMFSENWRKDQQPIHVPDFDVSTVYSLIRWVNCQELVFAPGSLHHVLRIADMFLVKSLTMFIADNFASSKTMSSNIWSVLSFTIASGSSNTRDYYKLRDTCIGVIVRKSDVCFSLTDFLNASVTSIVLVLKQSFVASELHLFQRCMDWSVKECERLGMAVKPANQRLVMEPFIYLIAFISMPSAEFSRLPCESGILTYKEQSVILRIQSGVENLDTAFRRTSRMATHCECDFTKFRTGPLCNKCMDYVLAFGK